MAIFQRVQTDTFSIGEQAILICYQDYILIKFWYFKFHIWLCQGTKLNHCKSRVLNCLYIMKQELGLSAHTYLYMYIILLNKKNHNISI